MFLFAYLYLLLTLGIIIFQTAVTLGAPLGEYTMGGKFHGSIPKKYRFLPIIQIIILSIFGITVYLKSFETIISSEYYADEGIWVLVVFFSIGTLVNLLSKSKKERLVMGPVNILMLISVIVIALN